MSLWKTSVVWLLIVNTVMVSFVFACAVEWRFRLYVVEQRLANFRPFGK